MKRLLLSAALVLFAFPAHASVLRIVLDDMIHPITDEFILRFLHASNQVLAAEY